MSGLAIGFVILIVIAILVVVVSVVAYNRHLDKVAKGEERDTHSRLPEPGTTVDTVFKTVLIVIVSISFIILSSASGKIAALNSSLKNMEREQYFLSCELTELKYSLEQSSSVIDDSDCNIGDPDYSTLLVDVDYTVSLKKFSDTTKVSLDLNGTETELQKVGTGKYKASFKAGLFDDHQNASLNVTEGCVTTKEAVDFPEYLFWGSLPMPMFTCTFDSDMAGGKLKYSGSYCLMPDHLEDIEKVTVTYMTSGKDIKTLDITKETLNSETITLEKGLSLEKDLTFRTEIYTKSGFKIVEYSTMIFEAGYGDEDRTEIYDKNGRLLWKDDQYKMQ